MRVYVLRWMACAVVALFSVCLPVVGGGSRDTAIDLGPVAHAKLEPSAPPDATPARPRPSRRDEFPRFLRPLPGEPDPRAASARADVRELLLSFDDGPDLFGTPLVLEELDRRGLKGVFFVNGGYLLGSRPQNLARRDLVRKLAAHGHMVANHTLTHKNLCQFPEAVPAEVDANAEIIAYATGLRPLLFRSPYGVRCRSLDEALRQRDLVSVGWNMDPQEWRAQNQDAVFDSVTRNLARLRGRAILLLHDTHPAAVRALPRILAWIDRENRRLLREGGTPIRIVDYSVFLPEHPVPRTGLEPLLGRVAESVALLGGALSGR